MLFLTSFVGITIILTSSSIFSKFRSLVSNFGDIFEEFIHCPMCVGFWVGFIFSIYYSIDPILFGPATSVVSWTLYSYIDNLQTKTVFFERKNLEGEVDEE